jgi:hypothetical protein
MRSNLLCGSVCPQRVQVMYSILKRIAIFPVGIIVNRRHATGICSRAPPSSDGCVSSRHTQADCFSLFSFSIFISISSACELISTRGSAATLLHLTGNLAELLLHPMAGKTLLFVIHHKQAITNNQALHLS